MTAACIVGAYSSAFGRRPEDSVKDLTREAYLAVLADAGLSDRGMIESVYFGNCGMWTDNQGSIRGQVCLPPLTREGLLPERIPLTKDPGGTQRWAGCNRGPALRQYFPARR